VNRTVKGIIENTIAVFFVLSAAFILSCEIPTDGKFGGDIRGMSKPLPPPKNVRATVSDEDSGTITITWDEVPDADGYNVYRSKGASLQTSLRGGVSRNLYSDSGKSVAPNTPYYYFVSAYKGETESTMSPSGVIELDIGAADILAAPEISDARREGEGGIKLTWTGVPGAAGYRIYRSSNYDDKQYIFKHENPERNYLDTNLIPGEYIYQVSAVSADEQEGYLSQSSDWVEIETDEATLPVPLAPQNVRADMGEPLSIILTWQAAAGATRYHVMRSEDGETYMEIGFADGETNYINRDSDVVSAVSWGGIYYYRVKPYNGNLGGYLSQACGPLVIPPAKPVISDVSGTAYNLTVVWTIEGSADGFRIYRSTNNIQYELLKTAAGNERSYTDTTAGTGAYYYRIVAYNSGGAGSESDVKVVNVQAFVPVTGITGVADTAEAGVPLALQGTVQPPGATNKTVTWTVKDAGETGANINGNTLITTAAGTATLTATIDSGLASGVPYTQDFMVTVSATVLNAANGGAFASALSSIQNSGADSFTIMVGADMTLDPQDLTLAGYQNKTIILKGDSPARVVSLASQGSLFTVGQGVTLELEDIVLQGRSDNNTSLVMVDGGALVMNENAKIAGNKASQTPGDLAGGLTVKNNGLFIMNGGEISGNGFVSSAHDNSGTGGVEVSNSTFIMNSGKITNNTPNSGYSTGLFGGLSLYNAVFTMYGGEISYNTATYTQFNAVRVGGVSVGGGSEFTMYDGAITHNTETGPGSRGWGAGGVWVCSGTAEIPAGVFTMHGGEISANRSVSHTFSAGGVCLIRDASYPGVFIKDGGIVYGSDVDPSLANTTGRNNGAAVYSSADAYGASPKSRNASLYEDDDFDSRFDGTEGGWE
jgi:fibronectin type 3 domain-containing protein